MGDHAQQVQHVADPFHVPHRHAGHHRTHGAHHAPAPTPAPVPIPDTANGTTAAGSAPFAGMYEPGTDPRVLARWSDPNPQVQADIARVCGAPPTNQNREAAIESGSMFPPAVNMVRALDCPEVVRTHLAQPDDAAAAASYSEYLSKPIAPFLDAPMRHDGAFVF